MLRLLLVSGLGQKESEGRYQSECGMKTGAEFARCPAGCHKMNPEVATERRAWELNQGFSAGLLRQE